MTAEFHGRGVSSFVGLAVTPTMQEHKGGSRVNQDVDDSSISRGPSKNVSEKGATAMRSPVLARVFVASALLVSQIALGNTIRPPGGTTPSGGTIDRLRDATAHPVPAVPPPPASPNPVWVPDRFVGVLGVGADVLVPGHWEQPVSRHEVYAPPLTGRTLQGGIVNFPAQSRPPAGERLAP